jgi:DNA helicase-2/ATP-dependent DNA helicase PcrA
MDKEKQIETLISSLNDKQKEAVLSREKHVRILAGAGSGKTKVLTTRMAYLSLIGAEPESILAVTFTNKAASEMKNRAVKMLPPELNIDANKMWIGTFHGLCNRIISAHHSLLNLPKNYEIIDTDDQKTIIRRVLEELKISEDKKEVIKEMITYINTSKERGYRPEQSKKLLQSMGFPSRYLNIYKRYEEIRESSNALDFGDILLYVKELFENNPAVKIYYQEKFQHILVDEYQDTNEIQELWLRNISLGNYLYVVGDDDQSIYGWRGAKIDNIINFSDRYVSSKTVKLEQNYRSTNNILNAANYIIKNNTKRAGKNLWSDKEDGSLLTVRQCYNPEQEAKIISEQIKYEIDFNGRNPNEIAILYRNNALSRAFESKLTERKIPYKIIGGIGFWSRREIKDILSYMSMINNSQNDVSFERTINFPTRGIGKKSIMNIIETSKIDGKPLFESLQDMVDDNRIKGKALNNIKSYINVINEGKRIKMNSPYNIIMHIIDKTNITEAYNKEGEEKSDERKLNIQELIYFARNFKNEEDDKNDLEAFLYHASLQSDADKNKENDSVQLMTVHASKGLEFPKVYIVGFEQGIFPAKRSMDKGKLLEEERRLAYVAITRGMETVDFSFSERRYNQQSEYSKFLEELPLDILDFKSENEYGICKIGRDILKNKVNNERNTSNTDSYFDEEEKPKFSIGDIMNHKKYGKGNILNIYEKNKFLIATVEFGFIGKKDLIIAKY